MARQGVERKLAAILSADVVGYSRLMSEDEAGTLARLKAHRAEFIDPEIASHGGRIVKLMGDGALVEFPSVVDAVDRSVAMQQGMAKRNADVTDGKRIDFGIGINLGDIIIEGDDIYGDGVNVAARIQEIAASGGVCISGDAYRQVKGKIDAAFDDLGEQQVKNIPEPVRVYRWTDAVADPMPSSVTTAGALPLPDNPSIAVLPFTNMSGDPEQEYFSDGITEDIITELSRFRSLFVIARNSSFAFKGEPVDVKRIARELGVRYILEGSVRRAGNRVRLMRITAQLLDTETGSHIWAEKFDRDLEDIFELQEEITRNVVGSIAPQIEMAELERSRKLSGANLFVYELSLKAQSFLYDGLRAGDSKTFDRAVAAADAALELDSRNIHALWTQGAAYIHQHLYRWGDDPDGALTLAGNIADRLVHIDASNPKAYTARAWVHQFRRDYDAANADYRRAMDLNPNFAMNYFTMAWGEAVAGQTTEAKEHAHLGLRLSPRDTEFWLGEAYLALAQASFAEGDFEETAKWGRLAIQMTSKMPIRQLLMIASFGHVGDLGAAAHHVNALKEFAPDFIPGVLSGEIEMYKMPEHNALLVDGLRKAGLDV